MKRILCCASVLLLAFFSLSVNAQIVKDITYSEVPSKAQAFIKKLLPGQVAEKFFTNKVTGTSKYHVVMRGRTEFIFNNKGEWQEIDGHGNGLPMTMLPKTAQNHITKEYGNVGVKRVVRDATGHYDVLLSNDKEMRFNSKGVFLNMINEKPESGLVNPR